MSDEKNQIAADGGVPSVVNTQTTEFGTIESSSTRDTKGGLNLDEEGGALAQETGSTGKSERTIAKDALHEVLADMIYGSNEALPREYHQNAETACIRAAKLLLTLHDDYGDDWLTTNFTLDNGDVVEVPRPLGEIMEAARKIGYDPTIETSVYHDDRKIVHEDPGIGMTAHELDEAFNTTGKSGVSYDADTGGKIGIGSLTYVNATGMDGDMSGYTATRKPSAPEIDREGIGFLADLDGVEEVPTDMPDDFRGTRFEIPVLPEHDGGFDLDNYQSWVAKYSQGLRVPVLYKEYRNGETIVEEEYGGDTLREMYDDPPVVVERPGEFSLVAGPNIDTGYDHPDCFLVSMPIKRNSNTRVRSLFSVVIQIHNEQGLIIEGPNRGELAEDVDRLDDDDVPLPQPTADRDRLQDNEANTRFFSLVKSLVKEKELDVAASFLDEISDSQDVLPVVRDNPGEWTTFRKILAKHGPHRVSRKVKTLAKFCQRDDNNFPTFRDMTIEQWEGRCQRIRDSERIDDNPLDVIGEYEIPEVYAKVIGLFNELEFAPEGGGRYSAPTQKKGRKDKRIGDLIASTGGSDVFMAASTGGKFHDKAKVVWNTLDGGEVVVIDGVREYEKYGDLYGWKKLKEVPCRESDDEEDEWDIPGNVQRSNKQSQSTSSTSTGRPDDVEKHKLKLRTSDDSTIDFRMKVEHLKERFCSGGKGLDGYDNLVLIPRSADKNISNNYDYAEYAAVASCTNEEHDELSDLAHVFTPFEFDTRADNTIIATTEGGKTARNLIHNEDRQVILAHVENGSEFLSDDNAELRNYVTDDIQDQTHYNSNKSEQPDVLWGVVSEKTYKRMSRAFHGISKNKKDMVAYKRHLNLHGYDLKYKSLRKSESYYQRLIDTPNWDDDSDVYDMFSNISHHSGNRDNLKQVLLALHDLGVDPTELDADEVRDMIVDNCESDN